MRRAAHNGCCRRVAQTRALCSVLWKLIVSEELTEALLNVEIPLVNFYSICYKFGCKCCSRKIYYIMIGILLKIKLERPFR